MWNSTASRILDLFRASFSRLTIVDGNVNLDTGLNGDAGDLLDDLTGGVQIDEALVDAHLEAVPRVGALTARRLAGGETEEAAESAVGEVESTRADLVSTLANDGEVAEVAPTPESSFSSPKPSPKGSSSHGQGPVLPHVLVTNPHEVTREGEGDV